MRVKYIIEYTRVSWKPPVQKPISVWALGNGRLIAKYRIGEGERQLIANDAIDFATERGTLPEDILEYKVISSSAYTTIFTDPVETSEFKTPEECAEQILTRTIMEYRINQQEDQL